MQVTPISKTLSEVLRGSFLRIPRFQRPYSWDKENLTDFWLDLVERSVEDYFMGSMVIYRDGKEPNLYYVVDGQQRLTTITITLAAIRDIFDELGLTDLADGVHNLLEARDLDNRLRFVLEHEPPTRYFQARIQKRSPEKGAKADAPEEQALRDARVYLDDNIRKHLDRLSSSQTGAQRIETRANGLRRLRDRLLSLQFISIELVNEDDAYLIFETLNTRGKDLQVSDLAKNLFARLLPPKTKGMDTARDSWNGVLEKLSSLSSPVDPDTFLQHYWLSTQEYVSKARLFKEMKATIKASNAEARLRDIVTAAEAYAVISAPQDTKWANEQLQLRDSLAAMAIFKVAQALPLVLAIMRVYRSSTISLAAAKKALRLIENFTFQFNAVAQSRGGGGIAAMYAKLAQAVTRCEDSQQFADVLRDVTKKLVERVPSEEEFTVGFRRLSFSSWFTRDRSLVKYTLKRLAEHFGLPAEIQASLYTIEHIRPDSDWDSLDDMGAVASMGNLLLVPESVNQRLGTKSFSAKKAILVEESVPMDDFLQMAEDWSREAIEQRTLQLAELAYEKVWRL